MRFTDVISECFTSYKIEKWNNKTFSWENFCSFYNHNDAIRCYRFILKSERGIFRLVKVMELDEL